MGDSKEKENPSTIQGNSKGKESIGTIGRKNWHAGWSIDIIMVEFMFMAATKGKEEAGASMIRGKNMCDKRKRGTECSSLPLFVLLDNPKFVLAKMYNKAAPNVQIIYPE